jgi:formylglycine-generating enzyme required for sulfatase activity
MPASKSIQLDDDSESGGISPGGDNHLLVIAIDDYRHCPRLNNCVKDARDFAGLLWDKYQFEENRTRFLLNAEATRTNILDAIRDLRHQVKAGDSLLLYYSGHGETMDGVGYWVPVEARAGSDAGYVSAHDLKSRLDVINSLHTFVIADACFSGSLFLTLKNVPLLGGEDKPSRWGLAASHSREKALDGTPGENSPFAERLLKYLRNNREPLGIQKLAASLIEEVSSATENRQTPVFKPLNVKGDDSGQFVFRLKLEDENSAWQKTLQQGTTAAFRQYLAAFPQGQFVAQAYAQINRLEEEADWKLAGTSASIQRLLQFIQKYPQGNFRAQARELLEKLEDEQDWHQASRSNRFSSYLDYQEKHPQGRFYEEASQRIRQLQAQTREPEAWRRARQFNSPEDYRRYLDEFPEGPNAAAARSSLQQLEASAKAEEKKQREEAKQQKIEKGVPVDFSSAGRSPKDPKHQAETGQPQVEKKGISPSSDPKPNLPQERLRMIIGIAAGCLLLIFILFKTCKAPDGQVEIDKKPPYSEFLEQQKKEATDYQNALNAGTIPALEDFIEKYPQSEKNAELNKRLKDMKAKVDKYLKDAAALIKKGQAKRAQDSCNKAKKLNPADSRLDALQQKIDDALDKPHSSNSDKAITTRDGLNIEMVFVRGGTFTMGCTAEQGSDCQDDEKPAHEVTLSDFYIGKYEVTQQEWQAVMGVNPSGFKGCSQCPVENVSWEDAQDFISKLNNKTGLTYRLPTEAEREYAARGGASGLGYKYAGSDNLDQVAWHDGNSGGKTHPVGQKQANELGLYDMSGNVWEWCQDWYGDYPSSAQRNPKGTGAGSYRVCRGGSWHGDPQDCRVADRGSVDPGRRLGNLGLRLARTN